MRLFSEILVAIRAMENRCEHFSTQLSINTNNSFNVDFPFAPGEKRVSARGDIEKWRKKFLMRDIISGLLSNVGRCWIYLEWSRRRCRREDEKTPHNPNYYLVINEFKTLRKISRLRLLSDIMIKRSESCCDVELTFSVYISFSRQRFYARAGKFTRPWPMFGCDSLRAKINFEACSNVLEKMIINAN